MTFAFNQPNEIMFKDLGPGDNFVTKYNDRSVMMRTEGTNRNAVCLINGTTHEFSLSTKVIRVHLSCTVNFTH